MTTYIPKQFTQSTPSTEVSGASLRSFVQNLRGDDLIAVATKYQFENVDADQWYPQQSVLNFHRYIATSTENVTERLVAVGMALIQKALLPPEIDSIEVALNVLGQVYQINHKNLHPKDGFTNYQLGSRHILIVDSTQYPDELHYGYIWAWTNKFKPPKHVFVVRVVDNPYAAKNPGTAFDITWGANQKELQSS